ncbi:transglycosylase SLT domain-containing protein [Amycolatopsis sp. NPDC059027]|uniref:transglycosylase SLT domain-containing protein n=1 Tax=Amycolatopsis sp. NPDC059027 TaxID=3346709 RepID=UPI00366E49C1
MALSFQALQDLWKSAGGSPASAPVAAAVALAESRGDPRAHNPVPPDDSFGLWQINMLGGLGPARRRQFGLSSNEDLYDPATNARAAVAIAGGGSSFAAWSTYTDGSYRRHLNGEGGGTDTAPSGGTGGVQQTGLIRDLFTTLFPSNTTLGTTLGSLFEASQSVAGSGPLSGFLAPFYAITSVFSMAGDLLRFVKTVLFVPKTWVRVACFTFGSVLVMAGLFVFFVGAAPIRIAETVAGKALP